MIKDKFNLIRKGLVVTEDDKRLDITLSKIGGKRIFVKAIGVKHM